MLNRTFNKNIIEEVKEKKFINNIQTEVAKMLLNCEAVKLRPTVPFTWASGIKSPIYCDNRITLSYPNIRSRIRNSLSFYLKHFFPEAEAIAGVATAGIPQGALVATMNDLPFLYVRSEPKGHGMENLIEGRVIEGQKIVVIEDLISTGGSSIKAANALKDAGLNVLGMLSVFTYNFDQAKKNFEEAQLICHSLTNYDILIHEGVKERIISKEDLETLKAWKANPAGWMK